MSVVRERRAARILRLLEELLVELRGSEELEDAHTIPG